MLYALQESGRALGEKIRKLIKITGTSWIAYRYNAMKVILKYHGAYMTHLEELANNDGVQGKRAQIKWFLSKWKYTTQ